MIALVCVALTAAVLAALLLPMLRPANSDIARRMDYALAVYRHQLEELERDTAHGLTPPELADAAKLEIQRRILASANDNAFSIRPENRRLNMTAGIVIILAVSLGSWQLYDYLGSPDFPDRPFAARQGDPDMQMNAAAEIIAAELEAKPSIEGYKRLGEIYYLLRRFDSAAETFRKAAAMAPNDAGIQSRLGESLVMENDGAVVMDAQDAFKSALKLDAKEPRARFYLGLAHAQIGEFKPAVAIWRDLEKSAPIDAPWLPTVKENIAGYSKKGGFDPASVEPAAPH